MKKEVRLVGDAQRAHAKRLIDEAPAGHIMTLQQETRSIQSNRLMWALIADIRAQNPDMAQFTPDQVKLRFLNALDSEMQFLPELWGGGMFAVGQRSSTLSKRDFSLLVELVFKWGAENGIRWSDKSRFTYDEVVGN